MASETQIGQLVIDLQIKTKALEKGLETAKKKLQSIEEENKKVENSNKNLDASYLALSATAVVALSKIGGAIKDCVNEYNSYIQAMSSLQNISEYTGESMSEFSDIMNKFSTYMTKSDLATTIKNFSLMGMKAEETEKMIEALTNSAIRNRNANYTVSEAVRVASEGYRQGLSTLSDSAGVTENLSAMLDNYARTIGKTASQLTETEKNQAYLNRTMYAAEPFVGAMEDYLDSLAGKQGQYSQALRETQVAYAEALEPTLIKIMEGGTGVLNLLNSIIKDQPEATAGMTTFGITLGTVTIALIALASAKKAYASATGVATLSTKAFTSALLSNPLTWVAVGLSTVMGILSMYCTKAQETAEAQEKLNEVTERYNQIKEGTYKYTENSLTELEAENEAINKQLEYLNQKITLQEKERQLSATVNKSIFDKDFDFKEVLEADKELGNVQRQLRDLQKEYDATVKANGNFGNSIDEINESLKTNEKGIKEANAVQKIKKAIDTDTTKTQQKEAAQLKINANQMQYYLNIVKQGKKNTNEYQNAVSTLSKTYPEAANAEGILIDLAQDYINKEQLKAEQSWNTSQQMINDNIGIINTFIEMAKQAEDDETAQKQLADSIGISYQNIIPTLTSVLNILQAMGGYTPTEVPNITPTSVTRKSYGGGSKSYQNKALDNYKKQIEYKKSLDQLSLRDEINMYEIALKKYAKTQDEKMELTTKVYELKKELQQAELDNDSALIDYLVSMDKISKQEEIEKYEWELKYLAKTTEQKRELEVKIYQLKKELNEETTQQLKEQADKEREILNQKTEDYKKYMEEQKNLRGAEYDVKEQEADLNKIIELHRNYLNQIMKDERYSLDEKESIYREELDTIRDYEQQKRDARVSSINDTVSQLKSAITKQIEEMEKADEDAIKKNIEAVEKWKDARIDAINEEYNARIKAIQDELDTLDKSEQDKSRAEEDAEYERKKKRLQELAEYEHDATTKANYLKELAKLEEEYQKTVDKRVLQDKKDALKEQQDQLKEEQNNKTNAIKEEAEKQKEQYETQLDNLKEYYDKQKEIAQETAEKMILNVEQNQEQILSLLKKYGDKYETTGQSLGEKLAQGINDSLSNKIQGIIQTIQDKIDGAIENQISKWTSANYKYEQATSKAQSKTIQTNVTQNNYIQQNPEMPSETYRKLNNVSRSLAAELAGI